MQNSVEVFPIGNQRDCSQLEEEISACSTEDAEKSKINNNIEEKHLENFEKHIKSNERILNNVLEANDGFWLFGYGSIIWKRDFFFDTEIVGYIKGYVRRFWQLSVDHRGTFDKPGRVVTLVPQDDKSTTWGIAYHVPPSHAVEVLNHLNFREKNGYSVRLEKFYSRDATAPLIDVLVYVAGEDNESFCREDDLSKLATVIAWSSGPSGRNSEYLLNLAEALRRHDVFDEDDVHHLYALEAIVKDILSNNFYSSHKS